MNRTIAALASALASLAWADAKNTDSIADKNKAVVERYENEFKNKENVAIVDELMAPDFVHHFPDPNAPAGREGLKQLGRGFFAGFPHADLTSTIEQILADGDKVVTQTRVKAVHKGTFNGYPATGRSVTWTEINIYRLKDGKIVDLFAMPNLAGIMGQLVAAAPAPAAAPGKK